MQIFSKILHRQYWTFMLMCLMTLGISWTASAAGVSPNIPLDSPVYTYLDKLNGLGYMQEMPTGTKPYTRLQAAGWVKAIRQQVTADLPAYARTLIEKLEAEFAPELAVLNGGAGPRNGVALRGWDLGGAYYDGEPLTQRQTKSSYQPLVINANGYKLADGLNMTGSALIEGWHGDQFLISLTPRLSLDEDDASLSLESGYLKTHYQNLGIQLGKVPLWWGQGERGSLILTNNMTPLTVWQLSSLEPIAPDGWFKILRQIEFNAFYADLESERSDVKSPGYVGFRGAFNPTSNITFALTLNSIVGGEGHELSFEDLWDYIIGANDGASTDKWDSIAGFDWRIRLPRLRGMQIYGNYYGEDQVSNPIPLPIKIAYTLGFYLPRLTSDGSWDLQVETAKTTRAWYNHQLYTNGYTYKGDLMGDAMGNNATRYYVKLSRYLGDGSLFGVHAEYLEMDDDAAYSQTVTAFWFSYLRELQPDLTLSVTLGTAEVENPGFALNPAEQDYLVSLNLGKRF